MLSLQGHTILQDCSVESWKQVVTGHMIGHLESMPTLKIRAVPSTNELSTRLPLIHALASSETRDIREALEGQP